MTFDAVRPRLAKLPYGEHATPEFWEAVRGNLKSIQEAQVWLAVVHGGGLTGPDLTAEDQTFIEEAARLFPPGEAGAGTWKDWTEAVKSQDRPQGQAAIHAAPPRTDRSGTRA